MKMNEDGTFEIERDDNSFPCPKCKGYSNSVRCTDDERKEYNCNPQKTWDCCCRAFVCIKCGHRFVMRLPAPECNW